MFLPASRIRSAAVATGDRGRFAIDCVHVSPTGTVTATDGHKLVTVSGPVDVAEGEAPLASPAIFDPNAIAAVLKSEGRKGRAGKVPGIEVDTAATNANGHVALLGRTSGLSLSVRKCDGTFPPLESIVPPAVKNSEMVEGSIVFGIKVELLADVLTAAKEAGMTFLRVQVKSDVRQESIEKDEKTCAVRGPIRFDGGNDGGERFTAVLAPANTSDTPSA